MKIKKFKKISFWFGVILVVGTALGQFIPLLEGESVPLIPFGVTVSPTQKSAQDDAKDPEVLGESYVPGTPYSSFAAGFSAVPHHKLTGPGTGEYLYLGGLAQGGVFQDAAKGVEGDGETYVYIYNPSNAPSGDVQVLITFTKISGLEEIPTQIRLNRTVENEDGIMAPLHTLLKSACGSTDGCNAELVGPETPWAGFGKVEVRSSGGGFLGIFAASQVVSGEHAYSFGHDALLPGLDVSVGSAYLINVGAGFDSGTFNPLDTEIMIGVDGSVESRDWPVRFALHGYGDYESPSFDVYVNQKRGFTRLFSDILENEGSLSLPWKGWVEITPLWLGGAQLAPILTANVIRASGDVGWGQNGYKSGSYEASEAYVGPITRDSIAGYNEETELSILNLSGSYAQVHLQVYCTLSAGGAGWSDIRGYFGGNTHQDFISVPGEGLAVVRTDALLSTPACSENVLKPEGRAFSYLRMMRLYSPGGKQLIAGTRDYLERLDPSDSPLVGRAHRHFLTGGGDTSNIIYVPAVFSNKTYGVGAFPLPSDPYSPGTFGLELSGWGQTNVNFNTGSISLDYIDVEGNSGDTTSTIDLGAMVPAPLDYFEPDTGGIADVAAGDGEVFAGYLRMQTAAGNDLLASGNEAGEWFWRSPYWEHTESQDTYWGGDVASLIPSDSWIEHSNYSSYVYSSAGEKAGSSFGQGNASEQAWEMFDYTFSDNSDVYDDFQGKLESEPVQEDFGEHAGLTDLVAGLADGVYETEVDLSEVSLDLSAVQSPGSVRIVFIKSEETSLTVNISPETADKDLFGEESGQVLILVVNGDVNIQPNGNAAGVNGGDFLDCSIISTGTITIEADDPAENPSVSYWQKDPVLVKGIVFGQTEVVILRDLGTYKNSLYPSFKVDWDPGHLIELKDHFETDLREWDIPGVY